VYEKEKCGSSIFGDSCNGTLWCDCKCKNADMVITADTYVADFGQTVRSFTLENVPEEAAKVKAEDDRILDWKTLLNPETEEQLRQSFHESLEKTALVSEKEQARNLHVERTVIYLEEKYSQDITADFPFLRFAISVSGNVCGDHHSLTGDFLSF